MSEFAPLLIKWQRQHGRHDLPWQNTSDPYRIWLSEIMLQQTQVATVIPYYRRFLARFPDVIALAAAPAQEVMGLWSGLGYYARARNLYRAAGVIVEQHGGRFPGTAATIAELPGIGRSTAAAIAVFAFGERGTILDGNVKRVLARCFGIAGYPGEKKIETRLWALAERLVPRSEVETYTQALMDLGAAVCTRTNPRCMHCPARDLCVAHRERRIGELPTPRPRRELPTRSVRVLILREGSRVLLEKRPPTGIWGGLLGLPALPESEADALSYAERNFGCVLGSVEALTTLEHGFTHFRLLIKPMLCQVVGHAQVLQQDSYVWLDDAELDRAALPAPLRRLLQRVAEPSLF